MLQLLRPHSKEIWGEHDTQNEKTRIRVEQSLLNSRLNYLERYVEVLEREMMDDEGERTKQ